jgi:hypothetical protein
MYNQYIDIVNNIKEIDNSNFKSNNYYNNILEHVSHQQGFQYLILIQNEFPNITYNDIVNFSLINDKYGCPQKKNFNIGNATLTCSPSNLRYIYHSLLILTAYKNKNTKDMVEVGSGYGGLFLAICYFSKLLDIQINTYYLIDLPEICNLITKYLDINKEHINITYIVKHSNNYGKDIINEHKLFFISNYCFTEIENEYRNNYIKHLIPKVSNGFIIWQTIGGLPLDNAINIFKNIEIIEEKPQTQIATIDNKNYFIYF